MFTLIKREIEDNVVYFVGAVLLAAVIIFILVGTAYAPGTKNPFWPLLHLLTPILVISAALGFCAMGVTQMYTDRMRKQSSFLITLAVTRGRLFSARVITGVLAIMTFFVPVILTIRILLPVIATPIPVVFSVFFEISTTTCLMVFSCYCLGLMIGWNSGKIIPTLGALILTWSLLGWILIKGFGLNTVVVLSVFIIACLVRTWCDFKSTSL